MRKFKLIKNYPGFKMPLLAIKLDDEYYGITQTIYRADYIENNPEFWQEVKEPLFVTEDGVGLYHNDIYYLVYCNYTYTDFVIKANQIPSFDGAVVFAKEENAQKWIEENKPKFSEKQIKDAIDIVSNNGEMLWFNSDKFKKELGIK